jgi:mannosyl-oligosaccharide alpha-1,2-mannosidase
MLSAYELSGKKNAALLANAKKLGDKLLYAWPAGYKTPVGSVDFSTNTPDIGGGGPNGLAAAASNILEFQKLTQFTGNQTYLRFANLTMYTIATEANPVFPGLPPQNVNSDGTGSGATVVSLVRSRICSLLTDLQTWDGGYDSYLEYLIKVQPLIPAASYPILTCLSSMLDSSTFPTRSGQRRGRMRSSLRSPIS